MHANRLQTWLMLAAFAGSAACTGMFNGPAAALGPDGGEGGKPNIPRLDPPPISDTAPFTCDEGDQDVASFAHRLSRRALERTLSGVLGQFLGASKASSLVSSALAASPLPTDPERYKRANNDFSSTHAQSLFEVADALSKAVVTSANYSAFATAVVNVRPGACTSFNASSPSTACQQQLIRNLGLRFLRRPLLESGTSEVELYRAEYTGVDAPTALGNVVFRMMLAPSSLFQLEVQESAVPGRTDVLRLSSHSIANRLSYTFWNAPPDAQLLTLAETTDLSTDEGFQQALDYVVAQPQLVDSTNEFFNDWLHLDQVPQFQSNNAATFSVYAGNVRYDSALRNDMLNEVRELGSYVTTSGGVFKDLFLTEVSFSRSTEMMKLYGVTQAAPSVVSPANAVFLPAGTHPGILTRAALLVTASGNKNPVLRGARIRRDFLCLTTPPPPADLPPGSLTTPPFNVNSTARDRYTAKTSVQPCSGCHAFINPPAFALSNFNGLGRYEATEPAFNEDGSFANKQLPIDASVGFKPVLGTDVTVSGPQQLEELIANAPEARKCFTQNYAAFFLARDATPKDGCRLNKMYAFLRDGKTMKAFIQSLATDPSFRTRKL